MHAADKHEYLNGWVYPLHWNPITNMAGASDAHVRVTGNVHYAFKTHLRGKGCGLYASDMRVKVDAKDKAYFYPDVMVTCEPEDQQRDTAKQSPLLIVEVLSPSTKDYDKGGKFDVYRLLSSLREYVLIDPTEYLVEIFRLNEHQRWELFVFEGAESKVEFASIGLTVPIIDLYEDVVFS
ncbi:MAG: Uma2 family endonuclease [Thiothrix sp.]|nr:MAG: Uma2 family endonuclease [Thiothrix sp.]